MPKSFDQTRTVLVAGATGYLGRHLVDALLDRGYHVRALVRDPGKLGDLRARVDGVVVADARDAAAVTGAATGVDAVVSTVGLVKPAGALTPHEVDLGANLVLLREAERASVRRFVYVSVIQRPGMERLALVAAKREFETALGASSVSATVVRPDGYFSDLVAFLDMARRGPAVVFGRGRFRMTPIGGKDLAARIADLLEDGPELVEIGGPETLTHRQIAHQAFHALGRRPRVLSVPTFVARAVLRLLRLLPASRRAAPEFILSVLSRDLVAPSSGTQTLADFYREQAAG